MDYYGSLLSAFGPDVLSQENEMGKAMSSRWPDQRCDSRTDHGVIPPRAIHDTHTQKEFYLQVLDNVSDSPHMSKTWSIIVSIHVRRVRPTLSWLREEILSLKRIWAALHRLANITLYVMRWTCQLLWHIYQEKKPLLGGGPRTAGAIYCGEIPSSPHCVSYTNTSGTGSY